MINFESNSMPRRVTPQLSGWGRIPVPAREAFSEDLRKLTENAVLSRGLGRSYGDSSLPPPSRFEVASTVLADRILEFDETTGVLRAEAGLSLRDLIRVFLRRNWFPPVSPGTEFVTLGGMVAADVHGKNHHVEGTFGAHVEELLLRVADGRIVRCSPATEPDLFWATVGGMGLTGHILEVSFRMKRISSPWIYEERERFGNVDALIEGLKRSAKEWPFTVGWIDGIARGRSLGRGVLSRGRWALPAEAPASPPEPLSRWTVPFEFPNWFLNKWTIRAFNTAIYHGHAWNRPRTKHPETSGTRSTGSSSGTASTAVADSPSTNACFPIPRGRRRRAAFSKCSSARAERIRSSVSSRTAAPRVRACSRFPVPAFPSPSTSPSMTGPSASSTD